MNTSLSIDQTDPKTNGGPSSAGGRSSQLSNGLPPLAPGGFAAATSSGSLSHRSLTKQATALTTTGHNVNGGSSNGNKNKAAADLLGMNYFKQTSSLTMKNGGLQG